MAQPTSTIRRRSRLQFSLRLLLLAFTAFAIGFPIWYRWPYQETFVTRFPTGPVDAPTGTDESTRVTTWQRQWGGGKVKHGPERQFFHKAVFTTPYINGSRNGTYTFLDGDELRETGQFVDDMREGIWFEQTLGDIARIPWHENKLDGLCQWEQKNGERSSAIYSIGQLTQINGEPFDDHLFRLRQTDLIDQRTAAELHQITNIGGLVGIPLKDFIEMMTMLHSVAIWIDPKTVSAGKLAVTSGGHHGMDMGEFLTLRLARLGLVCDYRYGRLWITTVNDVQNWRDPTGVSDIEPPPGTQLARAWNEAVAAAVTTSPLAEALTVFAEPLRIGLDTSRIAATVERPNAYPTVINANGLPFRQALGILLYETDCRCKLEGETLVILPPDNKSE